MHRFLLSFLSVCLCHLAWGQTPLPPRVLTLPPALSAAGTGVKVGGASWGYVVWQANSQDWYAAHDVAVYLKPGPANDPGTYVLQGIISPLTDPVTIRSWIQRANRLAEATDGLAEDMALCGRTAERVLKIWRPNPNVTIPADLAERLSMLSMRAKQEPEAAGALRQLGNTHPLFRFVSGTGWAGPLNVPLDLEATIELREVKRATGVEGGVLGRVTVRARSDGDPRLSNDFDGSSPGRPVQVPPVFLSEQALIPETLIAVPPPTQLPDRAVALRWSVPDEMRRITLLTRGFQIWRTTNTSFSSSAEIAQLEKNGSPAVTRLVRSVAPATKLFRNPSFGTGPLVTDMVADPTTYFVVDDGGRYNFTAEVPAGTQPVFTGTPLQVNNQANPYRYVVAGVDLLGRYTPFASDIGTGIAVRTVPPKVPDVQRVDNITLGGQQRLRITFKPNQNAVTDVPADGYLLFRDRAKNTAPGVADLDKSINTSDQNSLVYIGTLPQPTAGVTEMTFTDNALAPVNPDDYGRTYFYCVRAYHRTPFGLNVSSPSPPIFGTVRDRTGPPAPTGNVYTDCPRPGIKITGETTSADDSLPQTTLLLRLRFERPNAGIKAVRVTISAPLASAPTQSSVLTTLPDFHFGSNNSFVYDFPVGVNPSQTFTMTARAISDTGLLGHARVLSGPMSTLRGGTIMPLLVSTAIEPAVRMSPLDNLYWTEYFYNSSNVPTSFSFTPVHEADGVSRGTFPRATSARARTLLIRVMPPGGGTFQNHTTARLPAGSTQFHFRRAVFSGTETYQAWEIVDPVDVTNLAVLPHQLTPPGNVRIPLQVVMNLPVGAHEYRLYRRTDDGPLFMIKQDTGTWSAAAVKTIMLEDGLIAPAGGRIGYYGQVFDEHGNASPMVLLDQKVSVSPVLPVPLIDVVEGGGTAADPRMLVRATCPSPGVHMMEIDITPPPQASTDITAVNKGVGGMLFNFQPGGKPQVPQTYDVTNVSKLLATDPDKPIVYNPSIRVLPGVEYTFQVRALGPNGEEGPWTAPKTFTWNPPLTGSSVAWPSRPVPGVMSWNSEISAFLPTVLNYYVTTTPTQGSPPTQVLSQRPVTDTSYSYPFTVSSPENVSTELAVAVQIGSIPLTSRTAATADSSSNWDIFGSVFTMPVGSTNQVLLAFGNLGLNNIPNFSPSNTPVNLMHQFVSRKVVQKGDFTTIDYSQDLLPVVLYRQQVGRVVAGTYFTTPTADIVQASPMITNIAWKVQPNTTRAGASLSGFASLVDPYVRAIRRDSINVAQPKFALCIFDTLPVATGASYQYYLVHFNSMGEPDGVIQAGSPVNIAP